MTKKKMKNNFDTITFYCNFNNGDLHYVRSLLRAVMKKFPEYKYRLRHPRHAKVLGDLNLPLSWKPVDNKFDFRGYFISHNTLHFNVQLLAYNRSFFVKNSATIITLYNIFAQTLKETLDYDLPKTLIEYLPTIDYDFYNINVAKLFLANMPGKKVLICNNEFNSEQGVKNINFDFMITYLSKQYKDTTFIISNDTKVIKENVVNASSILGYCDGCDLNEISYISTFCDVIIGRYSGPHTFTYVKKNLLNPQKTLISFCAPSSLYGSDPLKWVDFGTTTISREDQHAKFFNLINSDEMTMNSAVSLIIAKNL